MANERLLIEVTEKGARVVSGRIRELGQSADKAENQVSELKQVLGTLGGAFVVRRLQEIADGFTTIQNRLRIVTSGTRELNAVTEQLFRISNATRSSFQNNAELYSRMALAARQLGIEQEALLGVTQSLNQAILLSGARTQEANNALIQLSQGIASNRLQGDELRAVLEQLPLVADVIAKEMNVTRGELRALGRQSLITGEVIINAFRNARQELEERFADIVPTLGQAFQVLNNEIIRTIGRLDQGLGVTRNLSQAIIDLSGHLEILTVLLTVLIARALVPLVVSALPAFVAAMGTASTALQLLTIQGGAAIVTMQGLRAALAILGGPVGLVLVGLAAALTTLGFVLSDLLGTQRRSSAEAVEYANAMMMVRRNIAPLSDNIDDYTRAVREATEAQVENERAGLQIAIAGMSDDIDVITDSILELAAAAQRELGLVTRAGLQDSITVIETLRSRGQDTLPELIEFVTEFSNSLEHMAEGMRDGEAFFGPMIVQMNSLLLEATAANPVLATLIERLEALDERGRVTRGARAAITDLEEENRLLARSMQLLTRRSETRAGELGVLETEIDLRAELDDISKSTIFSLTQENHVLERQIKVLEDIIAPQEEYREGLEDLQSLLDRTAIDTEQYTRAVEELTTAYIDSIPGASAFAGFLEDLMEMRDLENLLSDTQGLANLEQLFSDLGFSAEQFQSAIAGARAELRELQEDTPEFRFQEFADDLRDEIEMIGMSNRQRAIQRALIDAENAAKVGLTSTQRQLVTELAAELHAREAMQDVLEDIRGPQMQFEERTAAVLALLREQAITLEEATQALRQYRLEFLQTQEATTFMEGFATQMEIMVLESENAFARIGEQVAEIFGPGGSLSKGLADAIAQSILWGDSLEESLRNIGRQIVTQIVSSLIQVGLQMGINWILARTFGDRILEANRRMAGETARAWAPAAAATSLASFGANAVPASLGMASTFALSNLLATMPAFADGGLFVGPGGPRDDAGLARLSNGEFVVNAEATRNNLPALRAMNAGRRSMGGDVTIAPTFTIHAAPGMSEVQMAEQIELRVRAIVNDMRRVGGELEDT